ncbi:MAG: aldo/keto reductase [Dehalococcoidales bacterium]
MKMRFLGKSGIKVSAVCLGTMTFGSNTRMKQIGSVDQQTADKIVGLALDGGINFFDTADLYSKPEGQSTTCLHVGECKGQEYSPFLK